MRADAAIRQATQLQSITDQQDPLAVLPISVAAGAAMPLDQVGMWCYPERGWSEDLLRAGLAAPLIGRFHLSGPIDTLTDEQLGTIAHVIRTYKHSRAELHTATSVWPLGLPGWDDEWLCAGYVHPRRTRIAVWRRPSAGAASDTIAMRLPWLRGCDSAPVPIFDSEVDDGVSFDAETATLTATLPRSPSAVVLDFVSSS
jgi:alpha-galactosidase